MDFHEIITHFFETHQDYAAEMVRRDPALRMVEFRFADGQTGEHVSFVKIMRDGTRDIVDQVNTLRHGLGCVDISFREVIDA